MAPKITKASTKSKALDQGFPFPGQGGKGPQLIMLNQLIGITPDCQIRNRLNLHVLEDIKLAEMVSER